MAKGITMRKYLFSIMILCCLSICSFAQNKPLTVILDWFPNPNQAPLFVAKEFGFFQHQGLKVKLISPANPADASKLVALGKADLGLTYQPQMMIQINHGLPIVRIATLIATPLDCMIASQSSHINQLKDLRGKTIGYSSAATHNVALQTMLQSAGLTLKQVKLINVHFNLTQALLSHRIDAAMGMMRNFELVTIKQRKIPVKVFYPEEHGMPLYDELVIIANKKHINDIRYRKFLSALTSATAYLINHPEQTWKRFAQQHPELANPLNHQTWLATLPRFASRPAALDNTRFNDYAKFLYQHKVIDIILPLQDYAVVLQY